jgi:hypothetical protein
LVGSKRLSDAAVLHHDEGDAVGQPPVFVRSRSVKIERAVYQGSVDGDDFDIGICADLLDQSCTDTAPPRTGQSITEFEDNRLRCEKWSLGASDKGRCALMISIIVVHERQPIARINKPN